MAHGGFVGVIAQRFRPVFKKGLFLSCVFGAFRMAAEKLPGDPGVEICMSQAEFLAKGGTSAPSPATFSLRAAENARETTEACGGWSFSVFMPETAPLFTGS